MPEREMRKPLPDTVHVTPLWLEVQVNGPAPADSPYGSVTALVAGFPRHA